MVIICDYDEHWPIAFEAEKQAIIRAIGGHIAGVEHVGSTAVPGLAAKPTIDIMVGGRRFAHAWYSARVAAAFDTRTASRS